MDRQIDEKQMTRAMIKAMRAAGIAEELIYAFKKTGRLVTEENQHFLTKEELDEWKRAIQESPRVGNAKKKK